MNVLDQLTKGVAGMTDLMGAIDALRERPEQLCARPLSWTGSGEAVVLDGMELYKLDAKRRTVDEAREWRIPFMDLLCNWVLLDRGDLTDEWTGEAPAASLPRRKTRSAPKRRPRVKGGPKGRPTAEAIAAEHPGWVSVQAAAEELHVSRDRIHRAIKAGTIAGQLVRGSRLVRLDEAQRLFRPDETAGTLTATTVSASATVPAAEAPAADDLEAYS